jgi:hypothetical protein
MTQNDINDGRPICVIGIALAKPAEFVIFRIRSSDRQATSASARATAARASRAQPRTAGCSPIGSPNAGGCSA